MQSKKPPKLNDLQKDRLHRLEDQLNIAFKTKDLISAKAIVNDLQDLLRPTGHITRLVQNKNILFELAMEKLDYDYAETGFIGNRKLVNRNTRLYIEATSLLAICYLRKRNYEKAKPLIAEVLKNEKVIKSDRTRHAFHYEIIQRFDEEAALYSLHIEKNEKLDLDDVQNEAGLMVAQKTVDDIYLFLGKSTPKLTKDILFQIDDFAKNQLTSAERRMLPPPSDMIKDEIVGKTVFESLKRVLYNSLCDPQSEVYQAWFKNGMAIVLDKKYITTAVVTSLTGLGIGFKALTISFIALVIRFGLDVYCEHYKPTGIMEIRKK